MKLSNTESKEQKFNLKKEERDFLYALSKEIIKNSLEKYRKQFKNKL